jgi:hypothetical protein
MQSPQYKEYYHKENGKKREDESPTTATEETEEQLGEIIDSTTHLAAVKNKKRVHYPQINGEHSALNSEKTDSLQQNHTKSTSGK